MGTSASGGSSWRDILMDQVAVSASEVKGGAARKGYEIRFSRMHLSPEAHSFFVKAAKKRGISLSGYARRAVLARVAADLGLSARSLFSLDHPVAPPAGQRGRPSRDLDGELYGDWEVSCDESGDDGR